MLINTITKSKWLNKKSKILWRWNSSWKWNYCTKWLKWQKARSWCKVRPWFEWWQTPLNQRFPKLRWFKRYYKLIEDIQVIDISRLIKDERINQDQKIDKQFLKDLWYIKKLDKKIKILWKTKNSKNLIFDWIEKFSKSVDKKE